MSVEHTVITASVVNVFVTSNINTFTSERRFPKILTIYALKGKLELLTGASSANMVIQLFSKDDKLVTELTDNDAILGSYPVDDGMRIHVIDSNIKPGEFEDVSNVERFTISEDEYSKKQDSMRNFLKANKMGKYAEEGNSDTAAKAELEEQMANSIKVDDRCEVNVPGQMARRGTVKFVGTVHFKPGHWVGIQYDEPLGKNDGSVSGQRYFECPQKYGGFVKPENVKVGDYPEETLDDEDDEL